MSVTAASVAHCDTVYSLLGEFTFSVEFVWVHTAQGQGVLTSLRSLETNFCIDLTHHTVLTIPPNHLRHLCFCRSPFTCETGRFWTWNLHPDPFQQLYRLLTWHLHWRTSAPLMCFCNSSRWKPTAHEMVLMWGFFFPPLCRTTSRQTSAIRRRPVHQHVPQQALGSTFRHPGGAENRTDTIYILDLSLRAPPFLRSLLLTLSSHTLSSQPSTSASFSLRALPLCSTFHSEKSSLILHKAATYDMTVRFLRWAWLLHLNF